MTGPPETEFLTVHLYLSVSDTVLECWRGSYLCGCLGTAGEKKLGLEEPRQEAEDGAARITASGMLNVGSCEAYRSPKQSRSAPKTDTADNTSANLAPDTCTEWQER